MVLVLFLAFLFFGCTHERDNPYDPHGTNYNPSLFPSSSSLLSGLVPCMHTAGCAEISAEACFAFGGQRVAFCPAVSSSSLQAAVSSGSGGIYNSSSSSLPDVMVLCRLSDGTCPLVLISQEACGTFGGTPVQSCAGSSSSNAVFVSSSSVPLSSSSIAIVPSSGSVVPFSSSVPPSSSSVAIAPSSGSVVPFSSSVPLSSSSIAIIPSSSSVAPSSSSVPPSSSSVAPSSSSAPTFACAMTATTGTVGVAISPAPAATCNGTAVTAGLTWTPANFIPTATGALAITVSASSGICSGMAAQCGSIAVSAPTLACTMTATTGTVGTAITPAPAATCNGTAVTTGLTWTPANYTPTTSGNVSVSVSASSGICSGRMAQCGSVTVSPTLACTMTATTGTVGVAISPAPAVTCNGTAVTTNLTWTPGLTPTAAGNVSVSVSASYGVCSGMVAQCGSVAVSTPIVACTVPAVSNGSMTCGGQTYRTVVIGTQTWMAENLNYDPGTGNSACYNNQTSNCVTYGRLYDWSTAMNLPSICNLNTCSSYIQSKHQSICPSGWHIPSSAEWEALMTAVGGSSTAGTKLKATSGWNNRWNGYSGNGTDEYGFSALPGGYGSSSGDFSNVGGGGYWWSATLSNSSTSAYHRFMGGDGSHVESSIGGKSYLYSVRCLQD